MALLESFSVYKAPWSITSLISHSHLKSPLLGRLSLTRLEFDGKALNTRGPEAPSICLSYLTLVGLGFICVFAVPGVEPRALRSTTELCL